MTSTEAPGSSFTGINVFLDCSGSMQSIAYDAAAKRLNIDREDAAVFTADKAGAAAVFAAMSNRVAENRRKAKSA
jgi:hypothetical protein